MNKTTEEIKSDALSAMQDYFPNGGRDWDAIGALYDAIATGKIPGVQVVTSVNSAHADAKAKAEAIEAEAEAEAKKAKHKQLCDGFEDVAKPLIKWLAENVHPHHMAVITSNSAELLEGKMCSRTDEFLVD